VESVKKKMNLFFNAKNPTLVSKDGVGDLGGNPIKPFSCALHWRQILPLA